MATVVTAPKKPLLQRMKAVLVRDWPLYVMMIPGLLFFAIYKYAPMYGIQIAFKDYAIRKGINGSPWVDPLLKWFTRFFGSRQAQQIISNTLILSISKIICGLIPPLFLALAFSECRFKRYTRVMQTISYLPHFLSWVIIYGICTTMLGENSGVINRLLKQMGLNVSDMESYINSELLNFIYGDRSLEEYDEFIQYLYDYYAFGDYMEKAAEDLAAQGLI